MFSTEHRIDTENPNNQNDYEIALAGNPNVGKSTIFNSLTGLKQHTGNWTGKTVSNAIGYCLHNDMTFKVVDLPGTYSLMNGTPEEMIARDHITKGTANCTVIVVDATNLERNLNLAIQIINITTRVVVCVNMIDEAKKSGVYIDTDELSVQLGVPVVSTSASKNSGIKTLMDTVTSVCDNTVKTYKVKALKIEESGNSKEKQLKQIYEKCKEISNFCVTKNDSNTIVDRNRKFDKLLTSKITGIPIMILLLCVLFWITVAGANYPSSWLSTGFMYIKEMLLKFLEYIHMNKTVVSFLIDGVYTTLSWVVSVMLPPMMIFFPIFSLLEDSGYLPRIAFNLDKCFKKSGADGKQALTMAMGFGCNACGVMGCRIIGSERERNIAILTNNYMPCNGRLPALIAVTSIFIAVSASAIINSVITAVVLVAIIIFALFVTLYTSKILSKTILKGQASSFVLELPPYRKPQFLKTLIYSIKDRALFVLLRAVSVAIPAGAVIWCLANITVDSVSLLSYCTSWLDPVGKMIGLDGVILVAFILGFPANETVIPIMLMAYLSKGMLTDYASINELRNILVSNGWTALTGVCFLIMCVFHFPCSTTLLTIKSETKSIKYTLLAVLIPSVIGILLCAALSFAVTVFT